MNLEQPGMVMPQQSIDQHDRVSALGNILDRPNQDLISNNDVLRILQMYIRVLKTPKDAELATRFYDYLKYGFFNEQASLTFYDRMDKPLFDIDYEICCLNFAMTLKPGEMTQQWRVFKHSFKRYADIIFHRSVGAPAGKTNERIAQASHIQQHINTPQSSSMGGGRSNIISRIGSLFR